MKHAARSGLYPGMRASLASSTLSFTRDGRRLIAVDHDAVTITDAVHETTIRLGLEMPRAAIGFVDQIWIAHGRAPELSRFGVSGARIDMPHALSDGNGELVAAAAASPAALWTGYPALSLVEEQGTTTIASAPVADVVVPLTSRRWIVAHGTRITVPSGLTCELATGARVSAAAIVLDATAVLAVAERRDGCELVVIGLANARLQLRQVIAATKLRVAARRGLVAAQIDSQHLGVIDLRSGRVVGEIVDDQPIVDFALDPDGQRIALRRMGDDVELLDVRSAFEATRSRSQPVEHQVPPERELREEPAPSVAAPAPPSPRELADLTRPFGLAALAPVDHRSTLARAETLALLDRELRTVALWTLRAIAEAWDTRRIGYGNEGHHPYEHEVAALVGMNGGFAHDHVAAADALLAKHAAEHAELPDPRDPEHPLGALVAELGLSALAIDMLLVIAAPALWSDAARLYGILGNDPSRTLVDEALVERILALRANRHDIAAELDPRAPLVRLGIVSVAASRPRPFGALTVDPVVLARLRREVPDLGSAVTVRGSDRALEEMVVPRAVIAGALDALARMRSNARICVRGRTGSGRRTLLAAIAAEAGRPLGIVDVAALPYERRQAVLRASLRQIHLAGLLPCVANIDQLTGEHDPREQLLDVVRAHPGPLAVLLPSGDEPPFDPGYIAVDLPVLAESERVAVWQTALGHAGLPTDDAATLAARYRVGPGVIHRAVASVDDRRTASSTAMIEAFIRQMRDARLGAHARRVERLGAWDQLVLPPDIGDSLRELVARVRHRRTVFEAWGMDRHVATSRGLTALFSGPPGTGKTLVAGVIARELGLELYQVELSKLMSKWIGETERNLAAIFDAAEDGQVVLLFDEADSLFAKRTEVRSSNDRYANLEVNYLLQRLDSFEGIAILTTNASSAIDPAFKRRMSFRLSFPFPDEDTRTELWRAHLPATLPRHGELELERLARKYQLSGGYIRNACLRAAFLAAQDGTPLTQHHLERAVALEYAELGKLSGSGAIE